MIRPPPRSPLFPSPPLFLSFPAQRPNPRRSGEQIGQRSTLVSRGPRQRNLRKVSGPGNADFRVCRNEIFFGFANVRPALQKRRRKSNGNLRRKIGRASCRERV